MAGDVLSMRRKNGSVAVEVRVGARGFGSSPGSQLRQGHCVAGFAVKMLFARIATMHE
jgi:hypothetical protein